MFSNKNELRDYIRGRVKQITGKTSDKFYQENDNSPMNVIINKFPEIDRILNTLLTSSYRIFIDDIQWVSPKPTTFRVVLPNSQFFLLIWLGKSFIIKVSGKKYDELIKEQLDRAIDSISELLQYGPLVVNLSPAELANQTLIPAPSSQDKMSDSPKPGGKKSPNGPLTEVKVNSLEKNTQYTVVEDIGEFKAGDIITLYSMTPFGAETKVTFINEKGVKDFFILDYSDDLNIA